MSPEEMLALFTPQRRINPNTGVAVPKRGPSGRMEANFGVPGAVDPYEALAAEAKRILAERAQQAGSAVAYPFMPNTWNGRQVINPNGQFGGKIMEYSPTQKAAAGALGTGMLVGAGVSADDYLHPKTALSAAQAAGSSPPNTPASNLNVDNANPAYAPDFDKFSQMFQPASRVPIDEVQSQYAIQNQNTDAPDSLDYLRGKQMPSARQTPASRAASASAPMPPTHPAELAREQPSILSRIFSGQDYQSNNQPVSKPMDGAPVNWGNPDSAADFFRASKALQQARPEMFQQGSDDSGHARGGTVGQQGKGASGNNAALHKALEIIHHMLMQRH